MANSLDGQNSILSVVGPLGTSVGGVKLIIESLLSTKPWLQDPMVRAICTLLAFKQTKRSYSDSLSVLK
jgi:amidase